MASSSIIIIDSNRLITSGLEVILKGEGYSIYGIFNDVENLMNNIQINGLPEADIAIIDTSFKIGRYSISQDDLINIVRRTDFGSKVIVFTDKADGETVAKVIKIGIDGYLLKTSSIEDLLYAIKSVSQGRKFYSSEITEILVGALMEVIDGKESEPLKLEDPPFFDLLTSREIEVFKLVGQGLRNEEIAEKLFVEPRTISTHKQNIIQKLKVSGSSELSKLAAEMYSDGNKLKF